MEIPRDTEITNDPDFVSGLFLIFLKPFRKHEAKTGS